ncbi:MAG: HAD family phosphatase [Clostridiales bacterium]|nr:HAD family phosphatase [Clostridiales bacterium]
MNRLAATADAGILGQLEEKRAVLFDLDGTLVDSMWMWRRIDIEYLGRFGIELPPGLQKTIEGMSFSETAIYFKREFHIPDSLEEIKQAWIDMSIEKYRCEVPLKKGVRRFLEYLKSRDIRMGIATSNGRDMVDAVLQSLAIGDYFQMVTTACEVAAGKPAPDIYLKVADGLGVLPRDCMVFEDVTAGILAGKAAGMQVCAVEDAYSSDTREEKRRLADFYIMDYDEIFAQSPGIGFQDVEGMLSERQGGGVR